MADKDNSPADGTEQTEAIDYDEIADKVYKLMKADLIFERERAASFGGYR